jgi:DNA-binding XRE family transcriptional regulator
MRDLQKAFALAEKLEQQTEGQPYHALATRLRKMLLPAPSMREILAKVEARDETERAKIIGVSRQGYYNWLNEQSRPNPLSAKRIAELSGVAEELILDR